MTLHSSLWLNFSSQTNVVILSALSQLRAMFPLIHSLFFFFALPAVVLACEGECIVGITKAFLRSYSTPVYHIFNTIAGQIEQSIIPSSNKASSSFDYIGAILSGYEQQSYEGMENAIFPSHFHGKCQDENDVNPPGCPKPDCPVVCGTPGSLVHFYVDLRRIAFSQTQQLLISLFDPGSDTYKAVEKTVLKYANQPIPRMMRRRRDLAFASAPGLIDYESSLLEKRAGDVKVLLKQIMGRVPPMLGNLCGGVSDGDATQDELPACSWEDDMRNYILTFP